MPEKTNEWHQTTARTSVEVCLCFTKIEEKDAMGFYYGNKYNSKWKRKFPPSEWRNVYVIYVP